MMKQVFCFGELLLRMSPVLNRQWIHDAHMPVFIGGAELNVASALSKWGIPVRYCTALPDNYLSTEIKDELQGKNIDISAIQLSGKRVGTYYMPQGAELKNAAVIYDRDHSSFSELKPGVLNWDELLQDCSWFHFSAISPALNAAVAAVCMEGLEAAKQKGLTISVDLNYRAKLWKYGQQPVEVMPELVQYCAVVMGNIWAAETLLGIQTTIKNSEGMSAGELIAAAGNSMKVLQQAYPSIKTMAYTFRLEENYFAVLRQEDAMNVSKTFPLLNIVDKAGSGDCFMGGLIYGLYNSLQPQQTIDLAAAAAVGKMQEKGDATRQSLEAVLKTITQHG